jgi:hypothetical protein
MKLLYEKMENNVFMLKSKRKGKGREKGKGTHNGYFK